MRWLRHLASTVVLVGLLVGAALVLAVTIGSPLPAQWPDEAQLRAWVIEPVTEQTIAAAVKALMWLLWFAVAATAVVDAVVKVWRASRRLARLPLPTPLQATATGMAGAAVFGAGTGPAVPDQPAAEAAVAATADSGQPPEGAESLLPTSPGSGVNVPGGGWLPDDAAEAVTAAAALVWLQRRRDYRPGQPQPERVDADLTAPSVTVAAVVAARQAQTAAHAPGADPTGAAPQGAERPVEGAAEPLRAHHLPAGGVGLTGAGAADAARGLLVTTLLAAVPGHRPLVVTTAVDLAVLFGPTVTRLGSIPGLHVVDSADAALTTATQQARGSAAAAGPADLVTVLTHAPGDTAARQRLAASAASLPATARLAVIGPWPSTTWDISADGVLRNASESSTAAGARLCVLPIQAAADLLVLAGHTTVVPGSPAEVEPPAARAEDPPSERHPIAGAAVGPVDRRTGELSLRLLGGLVAIRAGVVVPIGRDAARQLLVYLAVHRDGASGRDLTSVLWPGPRSPALTQRLHTTISILRQTLHTPTTAPVVQRVEDRYRLHPDVNVDVWDLRDATADAAAALTGADRIRALREVVGSYGGDLAAGHTWPWLPPVREALRRDVLDAYTALAAAAPDARATLDLLRDALRIDPLNEAVHRHAFHALTTAGQRPAAVDLLDRYLARLTEAGLTPSATVEHLADQLRTPPATGGVTPVTRAVSSRKDP